MFDNQRYLFGFNELIYYEDSIWNEEMGGLSISYLIYISNNEYESHCLVALYVECIEEVRFFKEKSAQVLVSCHSVFFFHYISDFLHVNRR